MNRDKSGKVKSKFFAYEIKNQVTDFLVSNHVLIAIIALFLSISITAVNLFASDSISKVVTIGIVLLIVNVIIVVTVSLLGSISAIPNTLMVTMEFIKTFMEIESRMIASSQSKIEIRGKIEISKLWPFQNFLKVSLSHPKLLSKRHSGHFKVRIYPSMMRYLLIEHINNEKLKWDMIEKEYDSSITIGETVEVKLYCPVVEFSAPVLKQIKSGVTECAFTGIPKDSCSPKTHAAILTIVDHETKYEMLNISFDLEIVDFAFDHVSRPLLSNITSLILAIGSVATFVLTLIGQIDTTLGVTSGTTAVVIAGLLQIRVFALYKNMSNTIVR